jgi:hypothetical protein
VLTVEIASWKDKRLNPKLPFARVAYVVREGGESRIHTPQHEKESKKKKAKRNLSGLVDLNQSSSSR